MTLETHFRDTIPDKLNKLEQKQKEYESVIIEKCNTSYLKMGKGERCKKFFLELQKRNKSRKSTNLLLMSHIF